MKKVIVCGASGRMGLAVQELLEKQFSEIEIICVDRETNAPLSDSNGDAQVVIDFSHPKLIKEIVNFCAETKTPLVSGTTGFSRKELSLIHQLAESVPALWAANMSLGIVLLKKMLKTLGKMPQAEFFIEDYHHKHKKDSPSGTALVLKEELQEHCDDRRIPVNAVRAGGYYGTHNVVAATEEEVIQISHQALNRKVFAQGAITAATWLLSKPAGLYAIEDVLNV